MSETTVNIEPLEKAHVDRVNGYGEKIKEAYNLAIANAVKIGVSVSFNADKPFTFLDYGKEKEFEKIIEALNLSISTTILEGSYNEWLQSNLNNDKIVESVFNGPGIDKIKIDNLYQRNIEALEAFQKRKIDGFDISDRIWKTTGSFKQELEMAIDVGLTDGRSSAELSRDIRGYLNEPDRLFRRVRDSRGNLHLSKNAEAYHPGQGKYRSSFKNAHRLTRTETNMCYREADLTRWNQLPFIIGYEVKKSGKHVIIDICDSLAGRYPKGFKFKGWHTQCFCFMVPIMAGKEELSKYQDALIDGEDKKFKFTGTIEKLPVNFIGWAKDNSERLAKSKGTPYFVRDNLNKKNILESALKF